MSRRARIELPRMTAEQAIDLLDILQRISEAVWRVYGDEMAAHPRLAGSTYPPAAYGPDDSGHRGDRDLDEPDVEF